MKLLIITTHPIQYNAPLYAYLAKHSNYTIKVFYTLGTNTNSIIDNGFDTIETWNIDLLSGYDYEFIENISSYPSSLKYTGIKNPSLIKKIEEFNPDSIIVYGWKHHSHLAVMRYFKGKVPILFRGDSTSLDDQDKFFLFNVIRYKILNWVYKHVDCVLSPGSASDLYFKKSGLRISQIIRAEHAIDNIHFSSFSIEEEWRLKELKDQLSIGEDELVFVFAGKFIEKKNPLLLIKAFKLLALENEKVRLVLVGNGILEQQMRNEIDSLSETISKRVDILPFQDQHEMKIIYRLADVFVLPSKGPEETWGLSINEALASGTPVLVSDKAGCAQDLVIDGHNGYVFHSDNITDILQKMKMFCSEELRKQLKANTKAATKSFSYSSFSTALNNIFPQVEY